METNMKSKQKFEVNDLVILTDDNKTYRRSTGFYSPNRPAPTRGRKGQVARIHAYYPDDYPCYRITLLNPHEDQSRFPKKIGSDRIKKI